MNELCRKLRIPALEKNIEPYDVYDADEAFMAATPFCMLPVTSLNGVKIGNEKVGEVFKRILNKWSSETKVKIDQQIKNWNKKTNNKKLKETNQPTPYRFS